MITFNKLQTIIFMILSLLGVLKNWWIINDNIKYFCRKSSKLRKSPYFKKNFIKRLFLIGAEKLTSKLNIVLYYVEIILSVIFVLFGVMNLIFFISFFKIVLKVVGITLFITDLLIAINNGYLNGFRKRW